MTILDDAPQIGSDRTVQTRTAYRACPLCEAGCGLEITVKGGAVGRIRGDQADVFSHGYICPKGSTLRQLHDDPDRVRTPLIKRDGAWHEATWDEAFEEIERRLLPILAEHGRDSVAIYLGNPNVHTLSGQLYLKPLIRGLGTTSIFSASTVDQRPKELSAAMMFGSGIIVPVPDIDRTDFFLVLGANPYASNGSLATAPDWPGRIEAMQARGGRMVVVDPRRSRTAEQADQWLPIKPGADAFLLAALVQVLVADELVDLGTVAPYVNGLAEVESLVAPFTPEAVADVTGIDAETTRRLAHDLAAAPTAVVYGRIGTCTAEFGTLASWLVDVLNVCTGNLDRPGGAMFTKAAVGASNTRGAPRYGREFRMGRRTSRVRGMAESLGEFPAVALAEEMDTPGPGQIKAFVCVAGNPALSLPNGDRLDAALDGLDFMVSVDIYRNETSRHADVILPSPSALQKPHYDLALLQFAVRNVANWSPPVLPLDDGQLDDWEILGRLALVAQGAGATAAPSIVDDMVIGALVDAAVADEHGPIHGRDATEIMAELSPRVGPARLVDFMLRVGPYGDGFGREPDGLTLASLEAAPHGIDLGPLQPRVPEGLRTPSGMIELAPPAIATDVERLLAVLDRPAHDGLLLVGRRDLRSNNSWMHNVEVLVKGKARCTLHVHPEDASRLGLTDGAEATVRSRVGAVSVPVEVTDAIRPGVVSIPHGWGHGLAGSAMAVAGRHAGVNTNILADDLAVDELSGNAVLNGIPVEVTAA